jgi:hypothetical protein
MGATIRWAVELFIALIGPSLDSSVFLSRCGGYTTCMCEEGGQHRSIEFRFEYATEPAVSDIPPFCAGALGKPLLNLRCQEAPGSFEVSFDAPRETGRDILPGAHRPVMRECGTAKKSGSAGNCEGDFGLRKLPSGEAGRKRKSQDRVGMRGRCFPAASGILVLEKQLAVPVLRLRPPYQAFRAVAEREGIRERGQRNESSRFLLGGRRRREPKPCRFTRGRKACDALAVQPSIASSGKDNRDR